ncbi:DUF4474 domain-containing protein [Candidatus Contubernalis alkaliaceticus]|uniref:DUF4474 domain-containing protein n=1 Tax=Candidatus Contubernalis alkaliaceticus TaxID=338645 RepID=UPI001F4BED30|nr:DUF4474 domain-containing protein [Candidatus Contubernalis alkalaceticus]UNC93480.1 DUF4474 domain-containing protein [Candidatus Contubernalis alkalaceticus]
MDHSKGTGDDTLDRLLASFGYAYDPGQDIFYSLLDAWQRNYGYFRLYDEAAALFSMIMDCEPVYFTYAGKRWLIQFWKGQYGITTGCEVGVYTTTRPDLHIPGVFKGPFFDCAGDEDLLDIECTLYKHGGTLFNRKDKHWWVTGFILGAFSEPFDLTMDIKITLKDEVMLSEFIKGLNHAGYQWEELRFEGNTVILTFAEPRTPQPVTRSPASDKVIQMKNKLLCEMYQQITAPFTHLTDKFRALEEQLPQVALMMGKNKLFYEQYGFLKNK